MIDQKLDTLFTVRSEDNLYHAWRDFTPPQRDRIFFALWKAVRGAGLTRKDIEPILRDALAEVQDADDKEDTPIDEMLRKMGQEIIEKQKRS